MTDLARRIKSINARITTVQRIYGKESSIFKRIQKTISKAGGNARFTKKMFSGDLRQMNRAYRALEAVESSQYLTKEGRKRIGERARETFLTNHSISEETSVKLFDVFANSKWLSKISEYFNSSEEIVDAISLVLENDDDSKNFSEEFDKFASEKIQNTTDLSEFIDSFFNEFIE